MKRRRIGKVVKFFREKGYGFIECNNTGNTYFVHCSNIHDGIVERGYLVDFEVQVNDKSGKMQAIDVIVVESY